MATVTVKRGRKGFANITMKAGKGEDLRNVLFVLAGEPVAIDEDALYRNNIQSIRDQLNEHVVRAARQFKAPQVTHEERDGSWYIVIRETAV